MLKKPETLFVLGYMLLPLLALLSAIVGLTMILGENKIAGAIVLVVVTAAHRGEAFAACEFLMDYLKTRAPFWKKEHRPDGARWVEALASDDEAAERWESAAKKAS